MPATLVARVLLPAVGDRLEDLHRGRAAVRQRVGGRLADLLAGDGAAQRGARGVDVDRRAALLAGSTQERDLVLVALEPDGHRHAGAYHAVGARRLPDPGGFEYLLDRPDAGLLLALFLLG